MAYHDSPLFSLPIERPTVCAISSPVGTTLSTSGALLTLDAALEATLACVAAFGSAAISFPPISERSPL